MHDEGYLMLLVEPIPLPCNFVAADGDQIQDSLVEVSGAHTVPQVFINGSFLGGCDGACVLDATTHATTFN